MSPLVSSDVILQAKFASARIRKNETKASTRRWADVWPRAPRILWTTFCQSYRYGNSSSRFPSSCAPAWPTTVNCSPLVRIELRRPFRDGDAEEWLKNQRVACPGHCQNLPRNTETTHCRYAVTIRVTRPIAIRPPIVLTTRRRNFTRNSRGSKKREMSALRPINSKHSKPV